MMVEVIPAEPAHVDHLSAHMREADRQEAMALAPWTPEEALRHTMAMSLDSWAGCVDGVPVCLYGLTTPSLIGDRGCPWLVATDEIERYAIAFLRRNRPYIDYCLARYPILEQWVDARNTTSLEWMRWLKFKSEPAMPFGWQGMPFHHCVMER